MAERTRIFICYKKRGSDGRENNAAFQLYQYLCEIPEYSIWMDEGLDAGILWEKTIYEHLISSQVVILAIGDSTSESEWVRREISMAMSFGIQIIPVGLDIKEEELHHQLKELGLTGIHYKRPFNMKSSTSRAIVKDLEAPIDNARDRTLAGGYDLIKNISERIKTKIEQASPNLSATSRLFDIGQKQITIHIASGDIFRLRGYDILINSENDYMQMARIFDMSSFSSNIRHLGSSREKGYLEDTIQLEIEKAVHGRVRPVLPGTAIATSSGGPISSLYKNNNVSHVIHVAAVQAVLAEHRVAPLQNDLQIRDCVFSALDEVQRVCKEKGVISPEGSAQRDLQEREAIRYAPKKIVLPLFGTGRGGKSAALVGPVILDAILDFFVSPNLKHEYMPINDIHISSFSEDDVAAMADSLSKMKSSP